MTYEEIRTVPNDYIISEIRRRLDAEFYASYKGALDMLFCNLEYEISAYHNKRE